MGWERNGWKARGGDNVKNRELMEELHGLMCGLEGSGGNVRFWRVGRERNGKAHGMVREVLDRVVT